MEPSMNFEGFVGNLEKNLERKKEPRAKSEKEEGKESYEFSLPDLQPLLVDLLGLQLLLTVRVRGRVALCRGARCGLLLALLAALRERVDRPDRGDSRSCSS